MIILFDEDYNVKNTYGQENNTLGIGVLTDATSCVITEELNGPFELEMEYPIVGAHYMDINVNKVILAKPNDIMETQPFRIYKITKPINGIVTIYARHISYDAGAIPIRAINAQNLTEVIQKLNNRSYQIIESPFTVETTKQSGMDITYKTSIPYSLRALLTNENDSIIKTYEGELIFDRDKIILTDRRGANQDFVIRYSKNMTDLEYESSSETMYDGVCPYYSSKVTETKTALSKTYKSIYLSSNYANAELDKVLDPDTGDYIYPMNWLSYSDNGSPLSVMVTFTVVNMITTSNEHDISIRPGDIEDETEPVEGQLIRGKHLKLDNIENEYWYELVGYTRAYIDKNAADEYGQYWLYHDPELRNVIVPEEWNPDGLEIGKGEGKWDPDKNRDKIYRIYTAGDKLYTNYIWKYVTEGGISKPKYVLVTSDDGIDEHAPTMPNVGTETEEKENIILYEGDIIYVNEKRARINENAVPNSADWLIEVEENVQVRAQDPRWSDVDSEHTPINPNNFSLKTNYKVIAEETLIDAYNIPGKKETDKDFLTLDPSTNIPLVPENNQGYRVTSTTEPTIGKIFLFRWSDYNQTYSYITDTRYTYTNYLWNGTEYVTRDSSKDKILTLDITDKFSDQPSDSAKFQKQLYDECIKYFKETKLGELKDSVKVSFIKLSNSSEYSKWLELEKVALGDTVTIIYEDLGINAQKKVIKTEYNVLTNSYDNIELGEKLNKFSDNAIVSGDDVSALTNDRNYTDTLTASNLVAKSIQADYIKSINAEITEAQITNLTATEITAQIITASQYVIDNLVATLLVADDAVVKGTLESGEVTVNGNININSGSIAIVDDSKITYINAYINPNPAEGSYGGDWLYADRELTKIITPGDPEYPVSTIYKVYENSGIWTGSYYKWTQEDVNKYTEYYPEEITTSFKVDEKGNVEIDSGSISIKFHPLYAYINPEAEEYSAEWLTSDQNAKYVYTPDSTEYYEILTDGAYKNKHYVWSIDDEMYIEFTGTLPDSAFEVDDRGNVTANSLNITKGVITTEAGSLNGIDMLNANSINTNEINIKDGDLQIQNITISDSSEETLVGKVVKVDQIITVSENDTPNESGLYVNKVEVKFKAAINNFQHVEAWIYSNYTTEYGIDWLTYDGEEPLTPENGVIYKVYDTNMKWTGYYYTYDFDNNLYILYDTISNFPKNIRQALTIEFNSPTWQDILKFYNSLVFSYKYDNNEDYEYLNYGVNFSKTVIFNSKGEFSLYYYFTSANKIVELKYSSINIQDYNTIRPTIRYGEIRTKELEINTDILTGINTLQVNSIGSSNDKIPIIYSEDIRTDNIHVWDKIYYNSYSYVMPRVYGGVYTLSKVSDIWPRWGSSAHEDWFYLSRYDFHNIDVDSIISVVASQYNPERPTAESVNLSVWWGTERDETGTVSGYISGIFIYSDDDDVNEFSIVVLEEVN